VWCAWGSTEPGLAHPVDPGFDRFMADLFHIEREGTCELVIRKSRFLGYAMPCAGEADARERLGVIRKAHPKATHHVFAWRRRAESDGLMSHRFDDDGEPGGTAGRPLLQVLEGKGVVNAQLVVVRYFGGIKLGAGGLVRAYGEAGAKALAAAGPEPLIPTRRLSVRVPFTHLATLEHWLGGEGLPVVGRRYAEDARLDLEVPLERVAGLPQQIADLTHGAATLEPM